MKYNNLFFLLMVLLFVGSCGGNDATNQAEGFVEESSGIVLPDDLLDGMYPPYDLAKNSSVLDNAIFAWKEMIALSWQSTYAYAKGDSTRAEPDSTWSYQDGTPANPLVWETYAHRLEYRPSNDSLTKPFDSQPSYTFVNESSVNWNGIDQSNYFVVLDEDNEIGSCYVFADPNVTSVTDQDDLVMYMAKVNRVEYDHRKKYFNGSTALHKAISNLGTDTTATDNLEAISQYKDTAGGNDPCGAAHYATTDGLLVFPCSDEGTQTRGVIEIKTAWRPITDQDTRSAFLVREAVTFSADESGEKFTAHVSEYVLLGMHIIHKTNNYRQFFIATWEHNSVENSGYKFSIDNNDTSGVNLQTVFRHDDSDGAYSRNAETYGAISDSVQAQIRAANPDNFLANYRLTGFQSDLYSDKALADRKTTMPTYYLANLIIESDSTLADFSGSGIGTPHNDMPNVVTDGKFITVGGCSGCHGVAQHGGSDFSFLNDFAAKPIPEPDPNRLPPGRIAKSGVSSTDFQ